MSDLILLSGGLDSATLLADSIGTAKVAVAVDYGQRHVRELLAAQNIADHYACPLHLLDFTSWGRLLVGNALTDLDSPVPHAAPADDAQRTTVVPNRNALLLMAAAGIALAHGCSRVLTAVHAGDRAVYPDCRPEFIDAANYTVGLATDERVSIEAPFSDMSKADIARLAHRIGVPIDLTWSCYGGGGLHCGRCGACGARIEALAEARVPDPTDYGAVAA